MSVRTMSKNAEKALASRVAAYIENGAPAKVMAAECDINWGLFQHFIAGDNRRGMTDLMGRKMSAWLDSHDNYMPEGYRRCKKCGKVKPLSEYHKDKTKASGHRSTCAKCSREYQRKYKEDRRKKEREMANSNTEVAITEEIVKKVKSEDKPGVEPYLLAPYFGITPKQLEAVRNGEWDNLLVQVKKPEPAVSVQSAVEALRREVADMHTALNVLMREIGCDVGVIETCGKAD